MNKRLKSLMDEINIPSVDLKIDPDAVKTRVHSAIIADPPERKQYMRYRILKTAAIAVCATVIGISTALAASPEGRDAISSIISYFQSEKATEMTSLEELAKYNEEIGVSMTKDGLTITLDNVAADDNFVHVFFTLTSADEPFYYGDNPDMQNESFYRANWDCAINGMLAGYGNHNSSDAYFVDNYTYKAMLKYNVASYDLPDKFTVEIFGYNIFEDFAPFQEKLYNQRINEITDEEKSKIWYVSAEIDKSAVKVESYTKEINKSLPSGVIIDKAILSPFGNQIVVHTEPNDEDIVLGNFALYDENDVSLDVLNSDLVGNIDGSSKNSFEFLKADINTKQLKIVPVKWTLHDSDSDRLEHKVGQYPLRYKMSSGYGSVVVTDVRFSDGVIAIDYYKDGFIPYDPGFVLMNDAGENAEPGGKLGCVLHTDVHYETNSYTARYVYDAFDKDGNRIPADESVSAEALRANFTTLVIYDSDNVTLDFDNAIVVDLK